MDRTLNRRKFLVDTSATLGFASTVVAAAAGAEPGAATPPRMLDIHVHLFGLGDSGSGCRLSPATTEGHVFKVLASQLRLTERAQTVDEGYVLALAEQVSMSGLDQAVVLAQDAVYDARGKPDWPHTHFFIPNDYLFEVVARFPDRMIPCVSVNPNRADALDELDRCVDRGARFLKIHPPTQGVDVADKKHTAFFRRCAALNVVVMVHTGHEHSAPVIDVALADPRRLALALDAGCRVVACHCGTGWPQDHPDMLPNFLAMARRYDNLWGDTAVLGSAGRVADLRRLLADPNITARLLHGSDFPFPAAPLAFAGVLGMQQAVQLQLIANWMEQDLALKEALGIGRGSARRAYEFVSTAMQR